MTNSKSTKRALVSSALAILMCMAMLIGTTFAWFTDTASTGVNKIQSGKLDVALEMWNGEKWENAEGKTLNFVKAEGAEDEAVLWEPGCTYELPQLRVVNNGNLALKYKLIINGIDGEAKLNEVIDWTMRLDDADYAVGSEHSLAAKNGETVDADVLTIMGHMQETAGNEYQDLTIDGISITVYATQDTVEHDSFGNTYDANADMTPDNLDKLINAHATVDVAKDENGNITDTVLSDTANGEPVDYDNPNFTFAATVPAEAIDADATELKITITPKTSVPAGISVASDQGAMPYEIKITGLKENNEDLIPVVFYIGRGLKNVQVYHNSTALVPDTDDENGFSYDAESGYLKISPKSFSPFTIVYDYPVVTVDGIACYNLTSAVEKASEGSVISFCKSTTEPMKLENTAPITIKGVTFKSSSGVTIKGLQLIATSETKKVTLENVTFDGISFTDKVLLGQSGSTNGYSQCSGISFINCKFDMSASTEKYKDAIHHGDVSVKGTITDEKEANAYLNGLTVKNCDFKNSRYAINGGKIRNITVEDCNFTDLSDAAISLRDVAGTVMISGNTADRTEGVLAINTVGNNYSTNNTGTNVTIRDNVATNMTCANGYVFYTGFDNAKASGKSEYTITGNSCTYTENFDEPLNGFRIKTTYGPSKAEFIENK